MAKVLNCSLEGSKLKLLSCYYVNFWTNIFGNGMNPLTPSYVLYSIVAVLQVLELNNKD